MSWLAPLAPGSLRSLGGDGGGGDGDGDGDGGDGDGDCTKTDSRIRRPVGLEPLLIR